jgi:hypothetical protein
MLIDKLKCKLKNIELEGPEKDKKIIRKDLIKLLIELSTWLGS